MRILLAFSAYSNGQKILNTNRTPGTLDCVHGIRFLSMTWVILGHTIFFLVNVVSEYRTRQPNLQHATPRCMLESIHTCNLLGVNYSLNNGLCCTKWVHSHLLLGLLLHGLKGSVMSCVPIFRYCMD